MLYYTITNKILLTLNTKERGGKLKDYSLFIGSLSGGIIQFGQIIISTKMYISQADYDRTN